LRSSPVQAADSEILPTKEISKKDIPITSHESAEQHNNVTKKIPTEFFRQALEQASDDSGWAHLGTFGSYLTKLRPDFDSRNYGYKKLSDLVKARHDLFELEEKNSISSGQKDLYVRTCPK
jgi:hypothetical protein